MRSIAKMFLLACIASTSLLSTAFATDYTIVMNGDYSGFMFFDPSIININTGDRVRWVNIVAVQHTATSGEDCVPNGAWTTGIMNPGQTSAYITFSSVGTFPFFCRFHCEMGMTGEIAVKQAPVPVQPRTWGAVKALYAALTTKP